MQYLKDNPDLDLVDQPKELVAQEPVRGNGAPGFFWFVLFFGIYMFLQMLFFPSQGMSPS